ncbi:MAG: LLM class flavin-dependent oxidoreductase [Gordonia sp. (in: high G+C Gram-positive bacteria)]|uniref:LLM class flavin-dependent oxidoreductase n=1 Tax=Gordonia sp. (in: high G+C Gram-positive bacteria) TaxID=84139 RepID=UPI0039E5FF91
MRTGVFLLPDQPWADAAAKWRRAEAMGFDHAWTFDHLVWGGLPDAQWFSCLPTLTAAAMVTERIGLGSFVISPNFRHPVALSREIETLIDVSGSRFLAGLGVGGSPDDGVLGQEPLTTKERVDRFQEFATLLDLALGTDHLDFAGDYYRCHDMRLAAGSVRDRVPLLLAGTGPRSVRFAARHGDGWITTGATTDDFTTWIASLKRSTEVLEETLGDTKPDYRRYVSGAMSPLDPLDGLTAYDEVVGRTSEIGFTDFLVAWPRETAPYRASTETFEAIVSARL